jgi:cell cycle sensor histidine kinase DivJ
MPRIGDPFFQARSSYDRRHAGTGLGLSIVKGLLALHGGDIEITSRLGEGTLVTIRLPLDCERARKSDEASAIRLVPRPAVENFRDISDERMKISA